MNQDTFMFEWLLYNVSMTIDISSVQEITNCRICDSSELDFVLDLGIQPLSGVFPEVGQNDPPSGPLKILKCRKCELVQLGHNYPKEWLYGENYGYRSGLNASMVEHLESKARSLENLTKLTSQDYVLDIGSNDGTFLNSFETTPNRVGMDPTIGKFMDYYKPEVNRIAEFFSADNYLQNFGQAKLITSISMFYDLQNPREFVSDIRDCLRKDGFWHFEQSYLNSMLQANSYDTICHEHLEYYSMKSTRYLLELEGLKIIDVELNRINGGSFAVTATHIDNPISASPMVDWLLKLENSNDSGEFNLLSRFSKGVPVHRESLQDLVSRLLAAGKTIWGLGASTKGNVLLNYCGFSSNEILAICDVNDYKFNRMTPGSNIPICNESNLLKEMPDFAMVLPWHFRENIISRQKEYMSLGGKLIFPLPNIEVLSS
jgi:hypothetical protein